ncbi:unnamed protein product [Thelazia callipaeda]|uniref:Transcription termination factor 2 n=1 Tax=Thelazia callipaeda TaxID=103827 RepID=A0A0N5CP54_THECL|nr:unnamed protein product [Thelazia callipaeda]
MNEKAVEDTRRCYDETVEDRSKNPMGLRTIINTSAEPMDSGQMHGMKHDCDNEDTDVGSDHITASLLLNRSMSSPEVKDNAISQNANTDVMQLADTQEDVPSDPFVFSVHQLEGNKVRTTNGMSPSLAAQQLLIERPCDSSVCPHDPEPSTSKEDLLSKNIDNKEKNSMSDSTNGKCNLNLNNLGNSDRKIENDLRRIAEPDEDKEYQLSVRVPYENSTEYMGKTALCQEISPDIHKQEVSETDIRSERRREIIGTAPLSPNHYGSILVSAVPPSFQINKRSEVPGSCKTVSETNARRMIIAPERKFSVDLKELQQKKRKIEEEQLSSSNLNVSSLSSRAVEDQLQVPNEQVLNRALDLLRKPVQDNVNEPKNVPKRNYSKKVGSNMIGENKDSLCRKVLQEKIGKLRDKNGLALSVPHLERAHLSQLVNLLQRFKTHLATENFISKDISSHVFSDSTTMSVAKPQVAKNTRAEKSERQLIKYILDADATESENSDEETEGQLPSTSSAYLPHKNVSSDAYYSERVRLGALDATALCMEEDCEEKMITIYRQLDHIKNQKKSLHTWSVNDGCARCMPFDGSRRRILKRRRLDEAEGKNCMRNEISTTLDTVGRLQAYATVDDRHVTLGKFINIFSVYFKKAAFRCSILIIVHIAVIIFVEIPVERRAETYCRRKSTRPAIHLHKSFNRSPWTTYLEDRKVAVKEAVIVDDRQARRKREKSESEESYDDDEDYRPSSTFSRRDSCFSICSHYNIEDRFSEFVSGLP